MTSKNKNERFSQIHIDVARNATDDFNLFHDSHQWSRIAQNPFQGPIVLGFQIESLIENKIYQHRQINHETDIVIEQNLNFSNYQISFANAIRPEQLVSIDIKKTQYSAGKNHTLSNRISVKADDKLVLIGFKKETQKPLFLPEDAIGKRSLPAIDNDLSQYADRSFVMTEQGKFFLKRKFMIVSNAKNFLCGSLIDQRIFFDELQDKYVFPEIFPCAFISCALLEKALLEKLDFEKSPMVYRSHKISVDRGLISQLKSNNILHILIRQQEKNDMNHDLHTYECYGLVENNAILFRAIVELSPLASILKTNTH